MAYIVDYGCVNPLDRGTVWEENARGMITGNLWQSFWPEVFALFPSGGKFAGVSGFDEKQFLPRQSYPQER